MAQKAQPIRKEFFTPGEQKTVNAFLDTGNASVWQSLALKGILGTKARVAAFTEITNPQAEE